MPTASVDRADVSYTYRYPINDLVQRDEFNEDDAISYDTAEEFEKESRTNDLWYSKEADTDGFVPINIIPDLNQRLLLELNPGPVRTQDP